MVLYNFVVYVLFQKIATTLKKLTQNDNMKFMENFDPERSNRERRKLTRKMYTGGWEGNKYIVTPYLFLLELLFTSYLFLRIWILKCILKTFACSRSSSYLLWWTLHIFNFVSPCMSNEEMFHGLRSLLLNIFGIIMSTLLHEILWVLWLYRVWEVVIRMKVCGTSSSQQICRTEILIWTGLSIKQMFGSSNWVLFRTQYFLVFVPQKESHCFLTGCFM